MGVVLEMKFCLEAENETMEIRILRLWPRGIDGGMCCKCGLRVKMCCPETRECRVGRSLINRLCGRLERKRERVYVKAEVVRKKRTRLEFICEIFCMFLVYLYQMQKWGTTHCY